MRVRAFVLVCCRLVLLAFALMPFTLNTSAQDGVPPPPFADDNIFGVVEGFWLPDDVCELGAGWERIIFDWAQHQPEGSASWNTLNVDERWIRAASACDREVVAIVKSTPAWATDGGRGVGVPRGLYLPYDDPFNVWGNFMFRVAQFYAPLGVSRFIIWNEPDIEAGVYGYEFAGTLEDYAEMLKVASLAAKQGNPDAQIIIAGTTYWHDVNENRRLYVDRLLEHIAQDPNAAQNGYYFDAVSLHIYFRTDTITQIVGEFRALLDGYGMTDKRIWLTETNASPNLDPYWRVERPQWQVTLEQQSAFVIHAAALGLAAGADHIGVYKFYDWSLPPGAESFGLIRADQTRRPAFYAWQTVIDHLNGVQAAHLAQTETADVVRLTRDDGQTVIAAWARTAQGAQISVSATSQRAYLVDQMGVIIELLPVDGVYTLNLPGAVCHETDRCPREIPIGGAVTLLIQPSGAFAVSEWVDTPDNTDTDSARTRLLLSFESGD
jgi:hypothetical protein